MAQVLKFSYIRQNGEALLYVQAQELTLEEKS